MRKLFHLLVTLLIMVAGFCAPSHALSPKQHNHIARLALTTHIRPSYALLATAASELAKGMQSFCGEPTPANRKIIDQQFEKTLLTWSRIDHIRFGPIAKENRISRFLFWPDPKNIGLRQIKKALKRMNVDVLDVQKLQNKSVALQGLAALEYLLFGSGGDMIGEPSKEARFRCAYAMAITRNLALISQVVVKEWREGEAFVETFLHPGENNETYMAAKEVTLILFLSFTTELKVVQHLKISRPLGMNNKKPRPKKAAFWRSQLEYKVMDANMAGIRALFNKVFSGLVTNTDPGVEESVDMDFEQVHRDLDDISLPIGEAVFDDTQRVKLKNLFTNIDRIKGEAGRAIIKAADLSMGFNALDGD